MTMQSRSGIHAVLYALFDKSEAIDPGAMRAQTELMIDSGMHGVTVLGLATEVQKLTLSERRLIVQSTGKIIAGRLPFSVTVNGNNTQDQRRMVSFAMDAGADWIILQPPAVGSFSGAEYLDFFLRVAEGFDCDFAVQNAPQYLGGALGKDDIAPLQKSNPRFNTIKAEAPPLELAMLIGATEGNITVLNGRGGLEMTDCLRVGAAGFILAPDTIDHGLRVMRHWRNGETQQAEAAHANALPAIVFVMQSIEHLICYGKRLFGIRAGFEIHDRSPSQRPTEAGVRLTKFWAAQLGPFNSPRTK